MNWTYKNVVLCSWAACLFVFANEALGTAKKTAGPTNPAPSPLAIPGGGFAGGQVFTFTTTWDNNDPERSVNVTVTYCLVEDDPLNDEEFPQSESFTLAPGAVGVVIPHAPFLTAAQLNEADDGLEGGALEFSIDNFEVGLPVKKVPTLPQWGLIAQVVLLGTGGAVVFGWRRRRTRVGFGA